MSYSEYVASLEARSGVSVLYSCNSGCGRKLPITLLFFCGPCSQFVCESCTSVEIDTFFCPTCLNSVLSTYAHQDGNRCNKCVECPCCTHTLSTACAATTSEYTFLCEFCRWDSKSVGLIATKSADLLRELKKKEAAVSGATEFKALLAKCQEEHKQAKINRELADKYEVQLGEGEAAPQRQTVMDLQAHVEALDAAQEQKVSRQYRLPQEDADNSHAAPAAPLLSDTKEYDLHAATTLDQRLENAHTSPPIPRGLVPRRKHLLTKTAHRCRTCDTYVVKPKVGATHVAFDKKTFAITYIPTITVSRITSLPAGQETQFILYFKNPVCGPVFLSLEVIKETDRNCDVFLPAKMTEVKMDEFDASLDQEESLTQDESKLAPDDIPTVVASRTMSQVGIHMAVMPTTPSQNVTFALNVKLRSTDKTIAEFDQFQFRADITLGPTDNA